MVSFCGSLVPLQMLGAVRAGGSCARTKSIFESQGLRSGTTGTAGVTAWKSQHVSADPPWWGVNGGPILMSVLMGMCVNHMGFFGGSLFPDPTWVAKKDHPQLGRFLQFDWMIFPAN